MPRPRSTSSVSPSTPQAKKKGKRNMTLFRNNTYSGFEVDCHTDIKKVSSQEHHPCIGSVSAESSKSYKQTADQRGSIHHRLSSEAEDRSASLSSLSVSSDHLSGFTDTEHFTVNPNRSTDYGSLHEYKIGPCYHNHQDSSKVSLQYPSDSSRIERSVFHRDTAGFHRMKQVRGNQRFRKTIDNSDCQTSVGGIDNVGYGHMNRLDQGMKRRDCKSLSTDTYSSDPFVYPEGINPMYLHYEEDKGGIKVNIAGSVLDESSTDPIPCSGSYDVSGPSSMYPWQKEVGIQCDLLSLSSHEDLVEVFDSDSPPLQGQKIPKSRGMIRQCLSLDTGQKYHDDPSFLHNRILEAILERENVKRRVHSSSDAEIESRSKSSSKTYSASSSKPPSILKNSRSGSGGNIQVGQWPTRPRVYGSTSNLNLEHHKVDILPSPPLSPREWVSSNVLCKKGSRPRADDATPRKSEGNIHVGNQPMRRKSSDSINSNEEESDTEPSPTMVRQGRRKAIFDSRAVGVITAPDGDQSPSNSCDESDSSAFSAPNGKNQNNQGQGEKKFHDDLSTVRRKKVLIKRNTVHDFASNKSYQSVFSEHDSKKNKSSFSIVMKLIDKKGHKGKDSLAELPDVLQALKPTEFKDQNLISYKSLHWSELIASKEKEKDVLLIASEVEVKRREAVWELFKSECVFLVDHLMVLKHCFMEPMKKVQVEGHLMFAEPQDLFGNLDELCYVSYTFCKDFITLLLSDARVCDFGRTQVLVKALQRLSQLSRDGEVYHDYCLNYSKAVNYLEILRKNDRFCEFERWCENDPRCHRLQLADLLISPMQHCTKVPLLLFNIRKYTEDPDERQQLTHSLEKLEKSLKKLEAKMDWLKNFERVQEIQQQIQWQPVTELDPRAFIPEFLKPTLTRQPCEKLLTSPKRQLLHEGPVTLLEISKALDMYMFLFDDILLLTKVKKQPRKKSDGDRNPHSQRAHTDGAVFVVHKQPIALDRFTIHDVKTPDNTANGLRHAFVLVQISRFQQVIGVYTLQAHSETAKETWMAKLTEAQDKYKNINPSKKWLTHAGSLLVSCEETVENNVVENCLTTFLEKKEESSLNEKSTHHEPIIGTPKAFPNRVKMKEDNVEIRSTATSHQLEEDSGESLAVNQNKSITDEFRLVYNEDNQSEYNGTHLDKSVLGKSNRSGPESLSATIQDWQKANSSLSKSSPAALHLRSSQQRQLQSDVQEHSTQTDALVKRKPRLEKQQTTIGFQQVGNHGTRPTSLCYSKQPEEELQRVQHLVSPVKLRHVKCNGTTAINKDLDNEQDKVTDIDTHDLTLTVEKATDRVKETKVGESSWDSASPDDTGDHTGEQDKSPLLGKCRVDSNSERLKEIQKIRKLTRLKAIQEKNQSMDVIYI